MAKIAMKNPIVEMDGDEMTRVLWQWIKEDLICPYVDLKTEYYDLGLVHRDETDDRVTVEAAEANKKYKVGVKCATITPKRPARGGVPSQTDVEEPQRYHPPHLGRDRVPCAHPRQGHYAVHSRLDKAHRARPSRLTETCMRASKRAQPREIRHTSSSRAQTVPSRKNCSCRTLPRAAASCSLCTIWTHPSLPLRAPCFNYALDVKMPLWFATKDTISKKYDHRFKDIFAEIFEKEYQDKFAEAGIEYMYTLIDDAVARVVRSSGGIVWACKNYDGDVMSDMVATAYGSLGMMTSVLVSPDGNYEFEAAHGTVTRHYYKHLKGEETSTNSVATIFAWTGALAKRGELDGIPELVAFAKKLEQATVSAIEAGEMTGDLIPLFHAEGVTPKKLNSREFLRAVASRL